MSSIKFFSLIFFICSSPSFSSPAKPVGSTDPNSLYKSFLQCLTSSPHPDPSFPTIVYSSAANSSAYTKLLQDHIKNFRYKTAATPKPTIIITPKKETHVQAAVICAKKLNIHTRIRSGGHDYEGVSYTSSEKTQNQTQFMIIDMFNLHEVHVNVAAETAVVQAGAQLGELYYRIWEKSKVHGFPAGVCVTLGIGGHVSGGGYGTMIRKYGLSVDNVIDAKIVDVKGRILDRKGMGEDLFWAIRGGGGSSFCVVVSFTVKLVSVPKVVTVFRVTKTVDEKAVDLVFQWQSVMSTVDKDLFIRVLLHPMHEKDKHTATATFMALFLGDSTKLLGLMSKSFPELGIKKADCLEVSWIQSILYWANHDYNKTKMEILLDRHSDVNFLKRKSDYVQTPISKQGLTAIFHKLGELGKVGMGLNPYGGRMNEIPANATAFSHRTGNLFKIQYSLTWTESDPKVTETNMNQTRVMYEFMTNYVSKNPRVTFLNYKDFDIGVMKGGDGYKSGKVYGEKYFNKNFDRLVKVKTAVDPDNFFRNEQSIPVLPGKHTAGVSMVN